MTADLDIACDSAVIDRRYSAGAVVWKKMLSNVG
jgi:hypothetical protein